MAAQIENRTWTGLLVQVLFVAAALLLMQSCAANAGAQTPGANVVGSLSGPVDEDFARAYEPQPFVFPEDHGAHPEYQTEWWYFTGNLRGEDADEYGYQFTIFRSSLTPETGERPSDWATNQVYMAHFAVTDARDGRHVDFERFSRGSTGLAGTAVDPAWSVWLEDWRVDTVEPGTYALTASAEDEDGGPVTIDLTLRETRPPLLHGDQGLSQKGPEPGNVSYYYSLVGLETEGQIRIGGRSVDVTGVSWMDHEFGTSALSADAVGWDWFSVQLDDGTAIMLAQVRTADGGRLPEFESTLALPDGEQFTIDASGFTLEALGEWTSRTTGITYPSGWRIAIPDRDIALTLTPLLRDQEMTGSYVYWEGAVEVSGTIAGETVEGRGYVELTGYGGEPAGNLR